MIRILRLVLPLLVLAASPLFAQAPPAGTAQPGGTAPPAGITPSVAVAAPAAGLLLPANFTGAPPPELPATVSRGSDGQITVRAVRLTAPLQVDGNLDEDIYRSVTPVSDFIQDEPQTGAPATEKTEAWISFDTDNIYVSMRASESQPERMIVSEMRRDSISVFQNENFQVVFDTFHDRRNGVAFQFNPIGGRMDGQISNESQYNNDWNPIWRLQVRRQANGWTAEAAIPFKSLRYTPGRGQVWGVQLRRINRWKNERSYLTSLPPGLGDTGFQRVSRYATLVGLEVPAGSRALDIKPYVTSNISTDLTASPQLRNDLGKDFGFDVKYGVTQNLAADFTYNTDFAQVEADEQQVNLTRFSLFFPEKRDFFLENQGLFQFAQTLGGNNNATSETPTLFYSRRIGLDSGRQVPLDVGGRLSGRIGRYSLGLLNIQTGDVDKFGIPGSNFGVARIRRDLFRRSSVGALYTRRSVHAHGLGDAETMGVDGSFAFFQNLFINTYWAQTKTPRSGDDDTSYRTQVYYNGDRYAVQAERLAVGGDFDPQVGFMRRQAFHKLRSMLRFSPRPRTRFRAVRKFNYQTSIEYFTNSQNTFESRERIGEFWAEFQNSDRFEVVYEDQSERLVRGFEIARGVTIPRGEYHYGTLKTEYQFGQQRPLSGTVSLGVGPFYGGNRTTVGFSGGRVRVSQRLSVEPAVSINRVTLPYGDFTAKLVSSRATYTFTPLMFVSGLVQYNSSNNVVGANVRLRWEYQPGSELFVVYNDSRDTQFGGLPDLQNRALVVKVNRLFRF